MFKIGSPDNMNDMPAGYTYLGQFIVHDISFDTTSISERQVDPEFLWNFRTPALDLDSVYGGGPALTPIFYDQDPSKNYGMTHFLLPDSKSYFGLEQKGQSFYDLPRASSKIGTAIIADPRNDENIIISQIHAAFLQLHNEIADRLAQEGNYENKEESLFRATQQLVRWSYQWVVLYDYLPRVLDLSEWKNITEHVPLKSNTNVARKLVRKQIKEIIENKIERKFYDWKNEPFIPLEFSVAAFRFGHSQVLGDYIFNKDKSSNIGRDSNIPSDSPLFPKGNSSNRPFARVHMPLFFPKNGEEEYKGNVNKQIEPILSGNLRNIPLNIAKQASRSTDFFEIVKEIKEVKDRLDEKLGGNIGGNTIEEIIARFSKSIPADIGDSALRQLHLDTTIRVNQSNLAERNLIRGLMLRLPSGQSVAKALGLRPLTIKGVPGFPPHLENNTPLWYYILYEAKELKEGKRLGPVGSRIVAEVIIGLIQGDKTSFLNQDPNWRPMKNKNGKLVEIAEDESFVMADLLEVISKMNLCKLA